jgi:transcriptional regulator, araC family domain protein
MMYICRKQRTRAMKTITNPERLVSVPFSKTRCGVDFYINTGESKDICGVLTEHRTFKTDFFSFYFFRRANGYVLLNFRKIELRDDMVLLLSPHQQQEWHVDEAELDYTFLIFREDFMRTFIADKFFVYRLLYYYQTDTPPYLFAAPEELAEYMRLLGKIKQELLHPVADTYNLIVSVLYYLLVVINRAYAKTYRLPVEVPKNNYAFQFKDLLEKHIHTVQRVQEYADMLRVSRITLNNSVMAQFGVSATHLLKQRLLEELKNELLFSDRNVSQLADEFHFSDPSHLMRFFKQQTGKTFTQYITDYQNGIYE